MRQEAVMTVPDVRCFDRFHQRRGFVLGAEKPHRSFAVDPVGQDRRLDLHGAQG